MDPPGNLSVRSKRLQPLDTSKQHTFIKPIKRINEGHHVPRFFISQGYADIMTFVIQLNRAMCPRKIDMNGTKKSMSFPLNSPAVRISTPMQRLRDMLQRIDSFIDEAPPDTGPRRFGNVSFRKWYEILEARAEGILDEFIPASILNVGGEGGIRGKDELLSYLLGAFGSSQRLDYGTGHELSFIAFLGCLWKMGGFADADLSDDEQERSIVLHVFEPYLKVVRRLILTYTLEPAGSHGVWGLDDHSFMPYIFGSAQYCPAISEEQSMPVEGFLPGSPSPKYVAKKDVVEDYRSSNMYFSAVGFINDVKTGPFWEHSPILFDISGVEKGWGKINKGMIKMFDAEVLGKFPVVQHFPFGSLFSWDQDPNALPVASTTHTSNQPSSRTISVTGNDVGAPTTRPTQSSMNAPWATTGMSSRSGQEVTKAPWAIPNIPSRPTQEGTRAPWASANIPARPTEAGTRAPWAKPPDPAP